MTYKLKSLDITTHHWPTRVMLLRDGVHKKVQSDKDDLQAQVASGDYLALLATRLDQVSGSLKDSNHSDYIVLENTIDELLFLQANYTINKK